MVKYAIISPVRDESSTIEKTIYSVINQTIKPASWIIIDDNSIDNTADIVKKHVPNNPFINIVRYPSSKERLPGGGVAKVFNYGFSLIDTSQFDYIVKLDGDMIFFHDFFENIFQKFENDSTLGLASGLVLEKGTMKPSKKHEPELTFGNIKIYRAIVLKQIGEIDEIKGWDFLDNMKVQYMGYKSLIINSAIAIHLKPLDSAIGYKKENYLKGYYDAHLNYYVPFIFLKVIKKILFEKPFIKNGLFYLGGYLYNKFYVRDFYLKDRDLIKFIREYHKKRVKGIFIK